MSENNIVKTGRNHGRGGPRLAISKEQREAARAKIAAAPHGTKKKVAAELAALLDVHVNTLMYVPKKEAA